jgi:hypothetical protein
MNIANEESGMNEVNRIDGVMVRALASSVVDLEYEHRSCQTIDY